jgi:hypothetical protein
LIELGERQSRAQTPTSRALLTKEQGGDIVLVDGEDLVERVTEAIGGASIRLGATPWVDPLPTGWRNASAKAAHWSTTG